MVGEWTGPEGKRGGEKWGEKGGRKGARKRTRKTLILVPLWFRYSLVTFQFWGGLVARKPPKSSSSTTSGHQLWWATPCGKLSGPLNWLNAALSLLQPLDCCRTPSAIGSAIWGPCLALSRIHTQVGALNRLVLNRLGAQPRESGAIVSKTPWKQAQNKKAMEAAILNCGLDRDSTLDRRGPPIRKILAPIKITSALPPPQTQNTPP